MSLPSWLKKTLSCDAPVLSIDKILKDLQINTVCLEAKCPNRHECFSKKTATFMALGSFCTRKCAFCNISHNPSPLAINPREPENIAKCAKKLNLKHIVITMVTRDDLEDQGSSHMAKILEKVKEVNPLATTEVLTSDFSGNFAFLDIVLKQHPTVFNHNLETIRRLTPAIRYKAQYNKSLDLLSYAKKTALSNFVKSGIMVGLGESIEEIHQTLIDLSKAGCDIVTIGQYLQPSPKNIAVKKFYHPDEFQELKQFGENLGLKVIAGPFIRSSYMAKELIN
jgi:lipoic acid synthetase